MATLQLKGRTLEASMPARTGITLLQAAMELKLDWSFNCSRGTCARCRCLVEEGAELLNDVTDAEWDRMDEAEFEQGYRLGCQAVVEVEGNIRAYNKSYF
ncbi:(2Fe-2S)-binding protein [Paenibacillus sp. ACRRX]|uniref:2Fe-2S iron-sulfur cluster-binding protein n=1 Tax=unclassified Paenibacillus TaxID=185978 RepID=UPI001EF5346E|nr:MULTISPECIES: 2Fe-2S iron-sulfur cluster-binding protein [unclassified Paenibacillus]MCG7406433.1 (2Fe-2S)-binding protein [Paenibacillus sp. ACRRX]MDK8179465.1 2Fe-2S iron-sulfur cluster-binding protein [Paenibacillus sp. UMB4589-SE434]